MQLTSSLGLNGLGKRRGNPQRLLQLGEVDLHALGRQQDERRPPVAGNWRRFSHS